MDFNPHTLHQILTRIREQTRCPQCGTPVSVDFPSLKIAVDDFMLLELRCGSCSAFIVLHVNLRASKLPPSGSEALRLRNASSTLSLSESEMDTLRAALEKYDGSFEKMFAASSPLSPEEKSE